MRARLIFESHQNTTIAGAPRIPDREDVELGAVPRKGDVLIVPSKERQRHYLIEEVHHMALVPGLPAIVAELYVKEI